MTASRIQDGSQRPGSVMVSEGRRRLLRLFAAGCVALSFADAGIGRAAQPQGAPDAQGFIKSLGDDVLSIIKASNLSQAQRQERFRELFSQNFDVPTIGRFVVGRYWNRASKDEQQKYLDTFRNYVAAIYADQFSHYEGQGFKTLGQRTLGGDETSVKAEIDRQNQAPINVEFRVKGGAGSYKITDVTVENVSLIVTKRDEFSSMLEQGGIKAVTDRMQTILGNNQRTG